jgi:hypothetical protein
LKAVMIFRSLSCTAAIAVEPNLGLVLEGNQSRSTRVIRHSVGWPSIPRPPRDAAGACV